MGLGQSRPMGNGAGTFPHADRAVVAGVKAGRPSKRDLVIAALPGTHHQLAKKSDVSISTVGKWIAILRKEGAIHVTGWRRSHRGSKQPVFTLGPGEDKPEPKTLTQAQSDARFRKRNPERHKEIHDQSYQRQRARKRGHGFLATLFI